MNYSLEQYPKSSMIQGGVYVNARCVCNKYAPGAATFKTCSWSPVGLSILFQIIHAHMLLEQLVLEKLQLQEHNFRAKISQKCKLQI